MGIANKEGFIVIVVCGR